MKKKIRLNRETLRKLQQAPDEKLNQAAGGQSASCPIHSICLACYTKYYTCYATCKP